MTTSRRRFLGGAAAMLGLPLLPSLLPRSARGDDAPRVRLLWFFVPNGMVRANWTPGSDGSTWTPSPILEPIGDLTNQVTVLRNVQNSACVSSVLAAHAQGTSGSLSCASPRPGDVYVGVSADQIAAQTTRTLTMLPSLQVGGEIIRELSCEPAVSCAYMTSISWESPGRPLPPVDDPVVLFDQLVAGTDPNATAAERALRTARRKSVLDTLLDEASSVRAKASARDASHLDDYLESVRELERRVDGFASAAECADLVRPAPTTDPSEAVDLISDLVVHALACDRTRVVSYMLGKGRSLRDVSFLGVPGEHHEYSHHLDDPARMAIATSICQWELERFGVLVRKLAATPDGDGMLLDSCAVQMMAELGDSNAHDHTDLPVLLAGGAGGAWSPGRLVDTGGASLAAVHLSMLQLVDPTLRSFAGERNSISGLG